MPIPTEATHESARTDFQTWLEDLVPLDIWLDKMNSRRGGRYPSRRGGRYPGAFLAPSDVLVEVYSLATPGISTSQGQASLVGVVLMRPIRLLGDEEYRGQKRRAASQATATVTNAKVKVVEPSGQVWVTVEGFCDLGGFQELIERHLETVARAVQVFREALHNPTTAVSDL